VVRFPPHPNRTWGPHSLLIRWIYGSLIQCVIRPRHKNYPFFSLAVQPPWALASAFQFHDHFTDGRTSWTSDQLVARPLPKHRTIQTQNKYTHQTSMPCVGFEPTIPASERAKTLHALDRSATVTGKKNTSYRSLMKKFRICWRWHSNSGDQEVVYSVLQLRVVRKRSSETSLFSEPRDVRTQKTMHLKLRILTNTSTDLCFGEGQVKHLCLRISQEPTSSTTHPPSPPTAENSNSTEGELIEFCSKYGLLRLPDSVLYLFQRYPGEHCPGANAA
jgi:hypothetical protein